MLATGILQGKIYGEMSSTMDKSILMITQLLVGSNNDQCIVHLSVHLYKAILLLNLKYRMDRILGELKLLLLVLSSNNMVF